MSTRKETKGHQARLSLLGGSGETAYQPLSGASLEERRQVPQQPYLYTPGGFHERHGYTTSNLNSKKRMYWPNTFWTWTFFLLAVAQAVVCLAIEAYIFGEFEASLRGPARTSDPPTGALTIPTYLTIFIFGFLYQLVLVWDALRMKNTIQVIGICLYNLGMMIYAAVEKDQVVQAIDSLNALDAIDSTTFKYLNPCLIVAPCVLAVGTILLSFAAWKLYDEFAWSIYKHISADLRLKQRFLQYQIYIALLKFDFFFFLGFTVQFLVVVHGATYEFALTIAALPITIILLFLAAYITRRESKIGQLGIIFLYFVGLAYFVFKLVRMYDSVKAPLYQPARHSLTTFAALAILLLVVTIVSSVICMRNFDKGLKPHIQRRKVPNPDEGKYSGYGGDPYVDGQHVLGAVPGRMTID